MTEDASNKFAYLFYFYKIYNIKLFYDVSEIILKKAQGNPVVLSELLHDAAIDFRDILA